MRFQYEAARSFNTEENYVNYERQYKRFVAEIKRELKNFDWHVKSLAETAGVSESTIRRLMDGTVRYIRWSTALAVGEAVGLDVTMHRKGRKLAA